MAAELNARRGQALATVIIASSLPEEES